MHGWIFFSLGVACALALDRLLNKQFGFGAAYTVCATAIGSLLIFGY